MENGLDKSKGSKRNFIDSSLLTHNILKVGLAFEALGLSFALGIRIRLLKKESLQEHEKALAQARFLAQMSHEIRTPMNGVLGMVDLLKETNINKQQQEYLETLENSGEILLGLINDILDHSRIESGMMKLESLSIEVESFINQTTAIIRPIANEKSLILNINIDPTLPKNIVGDPNRLKQILINLLGNAIKFTEHGSVELKLSKTNSGLLRVEVIDTGIGIPEHEQDQLFSSYVQANEKTARRFGGTGLGLSISRQLVELMGGTIGVISEISQGACFWFEIDLKEAEIKPFSPSESQAFEQAMENSLNILVVEDNPVNQAVIQGMLERLNHNIVLATRGEEAIDLFARHNNSTTSDKQNNQRFDLVFMDCDLPDMDGFQTTAAIRRYERTSGKFKIPIIALTAHVLPEFRKACMESGMTAFLAKPLSLRSLKKALFDAMF